MYSPPASVRLLLTTVVVLAAASVGAWFLARDGENGRGPDFLVEGMRSQQIEEDRRCLARCIEEERAVVDLLLRGRMGLAEASAAFREAYDGRPPHLRPAVAANLQLSPEEFSLRMVLTHAEIDPGNYPDRSAVLERLRAEYEALCGHPFSR